MALEAVGSSPTGHPSVRSRLNIETGFSIRLLFAAQRSQAELEVVALEAVGSSPTGHPRKWKSGEVEKWKDGGNHGGFTGTEETSEGIWS